jgi:hypothetical protein
MLVSVAVVCGAWRAEIGDPSCLSDHGVEPWRRTMEAQQHALIADVPRALLGHTLAAVTRDRDLQVYAHAGEPLGVGARKTEQKWKCSAGFLLGA